LTLSFWLFSRSATELFVDFSLLRDFFGRRPLSHSLGRDLTADLLLLDKSALRSPTTCARERPSRDARGDSARDREALHRLLNCRFESVGLSR
jgi:hypothetical protein